MGEPCGNAGTGQRVVKVKEMTLEIGDQDVLLVTGATGLVGSHVALAARQRGLSVRALVRESSETEVLEQAGVELVRGDMTRADTLSEAVRDVSLIVHCAAKVGDWGATDDYRKVNVDALATLVDAAQATQTLRRFVQISSLGVYEARDHHGTDETEQVNRSGIDGYTLTKLESEQVVQRAWSDQQFPAIILRPGFIYGPRDRTVLPRLLEKLKSGQFAYLGSTEKVMNNTYVDNLCEAVFRALESDGLCGEVYNIRDDRLVSKQEFVETIARHAGASLPKKRVPLPVARGLASVLESVWKLLGKQEAPILSKARIKFLGLNLDYSIDKAKRELGYTGAIDFQDGMEATLIWFRDHGKL